VARERPHIRLGSGGAAGPPLHHHTPLQAFAEAGEVAADTLSRPPAHACATLLLSKNVNPKVVSEMLGHASIAITLDTYSHVLPTIQDSAAQAMEEALT
jgi:integrase